MTTAPPCENDARRDKLEVNDDLDFQRRVWRFERAGWVLMGLIGFAGLLGLLGGGLLSSAESGDERLRIEYQRFHRHLSPAELTIHIDKAAAENDGAVMEAARRLQGIERIDQIKYAVLEVNGGITIIPYR